MINEGKIICNEFEMELYLYTDNDLSADRKEFLKKHISNCETCANLLKNTEIVLNQASAELTEDLPDAKYDTIIERVVQKKKNKIVEWFFPQRIIKEKYALSIKLAVVGTLAAIAVIISLTTQKPNTVKTISNELLDWEGKKITSQINEIKNSINMIHEDNWDKQILMLDQRMKVLENESDKFSFN